MPTDMELLIKVLSDMKEKYEGAIKTGKYTELIRSKKLIEILHDFALKELNKKILSEWIQKDRSVYGYPKAKTQDILIQLPQNSEKNLIVGPIMTINVRSQFSSIEKNYDTLFERLFAEALNLHTRFPYMVLGYIYLLPKTGYDNDAAKEKRIKFEERYDVKKYITSFLSIANRKDPNDVPWKYEKICLLIVDFEQGPPAVMDDIKYFVKQGLISEDFAKIFSFNSLSIRNFFDSLHEILVERYYLLGLQQIED